MTSLSPYGILVTLALAVAVPASSETRLCDRGLTPIRDPTGYTARGNRCEGLYESPVSSTGLELVSLTRGKLRFELDPALQLTVSAPDPGDAAPGPVRVRAVAKRLRTYYRMDAELPPSRQLSWPVRDVLWPEGLGAERIGLFGWVERDGERIFVPLRLAPQGQPIVPGTVELVVRSTADVERVVWRWMAEGGPSPGPGGWRNLAGSTPAGQPITIVVPEGPRAILRVEVTAKLPGSDEWPRLSLRLLRDQP
jgi:hypothetical protein